MKASDWISVKDRLPELYCDTGYIKYSREVLLCLYNNEVLSALLVCNTSDNRMFWSASRSGSYALKEGTHWQPIVLPKKEKKWETPTDTAVK